MVGEFIKQVRDAPEGSRLATVTTKELREMEDLNEYSKRFHHPEVCLKVVDRPE
jgi:hypothetical protein